jgi:3-deoxy-7-phosphoheptulonate synthase
MSQSQPTFTDTQVEWSPTSWRALPATHQVEYSDPSGLDAAVSELSKLPPLVTSWEIESLKSQLGEAAAGKRFLLQGGDCAERFADCHASQITNKLKILLQMSLVLVHGAKKPVIRVGRIAGQYAKPRSEDFETRDGVRLTTFRGDLVNSPGFTAAERNPDPRLLLRAYERSAMTLNFIRALVKGGFADLHHLENWDLDFAAHSPLAEEFHGIARRVGESLHFMENLAGTPATGLGAVDFFTSHEALHLHYEEAQTRHVPRRPGFYNLSTHFPWIGMRTADPAKAHVEYFRGIANPVAVKVGPAMTASTLARVIDILNPDNEPGRLTLIHRFGNRKIAEFLPAAIQAVRSTGKTVLWVCDPMHGNTRPTPDGTKTRHFNDILGELEQAFALHAENGSRLGGVHFELTGEDVTECLGGARDLRDDDLKRAYRTEVDPRLNYEQALEMAMRISRIMRQTA